MFIPAQPIPSLGVSMAHDLLKFGLTLAVMAMMVIAMALFVSGYLSAFKPVEKGTQSPVAGITGGKAGHKVTPSPTGTPYNVTMRGLAVPQYAQYQPPGPMIPEAVRAPVPIEGVMQPPAMRPSPSPPAPSPEPTITLLPSTAPKQPSYQVMPMTPYVTGWYNIIQQLLQILPLIFSGQYGMFPVWPQFCW